MTQPKWELLGHAAVDSGQLLLIDPSYLRHWQEEEFKDIRIYEHKVTGDRLQYKVDFDHYMQPIARHGGLNMNELNETGEWRQLPLPPAEHALSYNACCLATLDGPMGGQVDLGVAFSTGWGDGNYPVKVQRNKEGRIMRVLIEFDDEEG